MKKNLSQNFHLKNKPSVLLEKINNSIDVDHRLYMEDISGSIAHCKMLIKTKIISSKEGNTINRGLKQISNDIQRGKIKFDPKLEDIHMNIESLLFKKIGNVAGNLHTARSRNDQVVTDLKLWIRSQSKVINKKIQSFQKSLLQISKKNIETVMPGYTHMQIAQPVSLAHHIMAYVEMFGRDRGRFQNCVTRLNENPLGSGALAGTSFNIDRKLTSKLLGFAKPTANSIDTVSDRDFAIEFIFCLSLVGIHLSRLAEEIILWASQHFQYVVLPDELSTGSSIMPQKKNPDGAELVRAKTASAISNLNNILSLIKSLPLTYSKDLQEDKKIIFETFDNIHLSLDVMIEIMSKIKFNKKNMLTTVNNSYATATDLADWLVKKLGYTFREAYMITGKIVNYATSKKILLPNLSLNELRKFDKNITKNVYNILSSKNSMNSKKSIGGTSSLIVKKAIQQATKKYL